VIASRTDPRWAAQAAAGIDGVLEDHAHCERKAAATALSLVAAYPERERLVRAMSALALEEIAHFRAVHERLCRRGRALGRDPGDPYAQSLRRLVRADEPERLTDRLLVAGLIESRSCERLGLLAAALADPELAAFYASLARVEAGHAELFVSLAREYADPGCVDARLAELAAAEAEIAAGLPLEPRIH
jgi:tRNA-(ms[2]io[6]A)-hydroxylase